MHKELAARTKDRIREVQEEYPLKRIGPLTRISPAGTSPEVSYPMSGIARSLYSRIGEGMPTLPLDSCNKKEGISSFALPFHMEGHTLARS